MFVNSISKVFISIIANDLLDYKVSKYFQDLNIIIININTLLLVILASVSIVIISLFINYGSRISK